MLKKSYINTTQAEIDAFHKRDLNFITFDNVYCDMRLFDDEGDLMEESLDIKVVNAYEMYELFKNLTFPGQDFIHVKRDNWVYHCMPTEGDLYNASLSQEDKAMFYIYKESDNIPLNVAVYNVINLIEHL